LEIIFATKLGSVYCVEREHLCYSIGNKTGQYLTKEDIAFV